MSYRSFIKGVDKWVDKFQTRCILIPQLKKVGICHFQTGTFSGYISFLLSSKISWDILIVHHIYSNSKTILQKNTNWPCLCRARIFGNAKNPALGTNATATHLPNSAVFGRDMPTFRTRCLSRIWAHLTYWPTVDGEENSGEKTTWDA